MKTEHESVAELKTTKSRGAALDEIGIAPAVARILDVPEPGVLLVRHGEMVARARMSVAVAAEAPDSLVGREVVLLFEGNDPVKPIALTLLHSPFSDSSAAVEFEESGDLDARVDGRRVVIRAEEKLELRCGKASIVIDAAGKITIRGAHLLSRSTGPIRIKGGHVDIN